VLFGRLEHDARSWGVGHLRGLAEQRVQQVDDVELAEPVDLEMAINAVVRLAVLVGDDSGGGYKLRSRSVFRPLNRQ